MISAHNITKYYGSFPALKDVSLTIKKGEIVGLLGPNGAGKTTMMKIITCFMPPSGGHIVVGQDSTEGEVVNIKRRIGYLPENAPLYTDMTVMEYLDYIAGMHDIPKNKRKESIMNVIKTCSLEEKAHQNTGQLSKGYRQRVGLAAALIHDPEILILDEPTSGLDPNQIVEIRDLIKNIKKEKTILLSTHILSEVEATCDRIIIINKGRIVAQGTKEELQGAFTPETSIIITIEGSATGLPTLLKKISGVIDTTIYKQENEKTSKVRVITETGKDPRREIIKVLTQHNYTFLEIETEGASLEEVFARLTFEKK